MTAFLRSSVTVALLLTIAVPVPAQTRQSVDLLLSKARSLEARGRLDLAAQNWNQVLLVNPNQTEALKGLARFAKQNGDAEGLRTYLARLRKINPGDPGIAAIEKMHVLTQQEIKWLDEARHLSTQHRPDEAMTLYRQVFGDTPPTGQWAEAFYETEAASTGGRERAIDQLRAVSLGDPENELYRLWLGRVLTYSPSTRMEGLRLLESVAAPGAVEQARTIWHQALVWEKDNPAAEASLEAYLRRYPDRELQNSLIAQNGFNALHEKNLGMAQAKFEQLLRESPNDANGVVGLGFVRLGQKNFDQALALFNKARAMAPQRSDAKEGYDAARFWLAMERGAAQQATNPEAALAAYEAALALQPQNEQALLGIAQIMLRRGNFTEARAKFEQIERESPRNVDALAGLGFVRLGQKDFDDAARLLARAQALAPDRREIGEGVRRARFWGLMQEGAAALDQSRADAAVARYREALAIDPRSVDALAGFADATRRTGNLAEAIKAYGSVTDADPSDTRGWLGLMRTETEANEPRAALESIQSIPQAARQRLETQPEYLARLALAFYSADQSAAGDQALRRAIDAGVRSDTDEAVNARLEVATLLLKQGKGDSAVSIYEQAADAHPNTAAIWERLIEAYTRLGNIPKAMTVVQSMPRGSYNRAADRPGFLNVVASVYSAAGRCSEAEGLLNRSLDLDRVAGHHPAENTQLQLADLWAREGLYGQALRGYRNVLTTNEHSLGGWRGYITALHLQKEDDAVLAESQRMPAGVRGALTSDPNFLRLLSSAQSAVGHTEQAVELLQEARARHRALGETSPADLDVQLAWTMMDDPKHRPEVPALVAETRLRTDLMETHRDALDAISSSFAVRMAEEAMRAQEPLRAVGILTNAARGEPGNPRIHSALALMYLRLGEYERALAEYRSWGMAGADAGDYRAAAAAALAAQRTVVAEQFLWEGRQRWPNDAELLHMTALHELSREQYDSTEHYLTLALAAARAQEANGAQGNAGTSTAPGEMPRTANGDSAVSGGPACRPDVVPGSTAAPERGKAPADRRDPLQISADQIQDEIAIVRDRNTPVAGVASPFTFRAGDPGLNRLMVRDGVASGSITIGDAVRVGVDAHSLYLDSGTPDGRSGYRFGTLPLGATFAEQTASGWGGEVQVSGRTFGLAVGITPKDFPVPNWTGGLRLGAPDGWVKFMAVRDSVKDSLLSYAGARDPRTGIVWGGVVLNSGTLQFSHDESGNGQYASVGASLFRGENVADNWSTQGTAGAYWRVAASGEGRLSVGLNVTGMHYDKNLNFFSLGHGGYFSPQRYILGSIPISWVDRRNRIEYQIVGSGGIQSLEEDQAPLNPTQSGGLKPYYAADSHTGPNYDLSFRLDYHIAPHWYFGAFFQANNARDFASQSFGFTLRLLTSPVPTGTPLRLKTIPNWRGDPPFTF